MMELNFSLMAIQEIHAVDTAHHTKQLLQAEIQSICIMLV